MTDKKNCDNCKHFHWYHDYCDYWNTLYRAVYACSEPEEEEDEPPYPCRVCDDYCFRTAQCKSNRGCGKDENTIDAIMKGKMQDG